MLSSGSINFFTSSESAKSSLNPPAGAAKLHAKSPETTPVTKTTQENTSTDNSYIMFERKHSFSSECSELSGMTNFTELGKCDHYSEDVHGPEVLEVARMTLEDEQSAQYEKDFRTMCAQEAYNEKLLSGDVIKVQRSSERFSLAKLSISSGSNEHNSEKTSNIDELLKSSAACCTIS